MSIIYLDAGVYVCFILPNDTAPIFKFFEIILAFYKGNGNWVHAGLKARDEWPIVVVQLRTNAGLHTAMEMKACKEGELWRKDYSIGAVLAIAQRTSITNTQDQRQSWQDTGLHLPHGFKMMRQTAPRASAKRVSHFLTKPHFLTKCGKQRLGTAQTASAGRSNHWVIFVLLT